MIQSIAALASAFALALSAAPAAPGGGPPAPIAVEALGDLPFISDPLLSPDGKRIVARISADGREELAIYTLPAGANAQPTFIPLGGAQASWFGWAGNDRVLIGHRITFFMMTSAGFGLFPATRLKRYDVGSKTLIDIGKGRGLLGDDVIFTDPDGRFVLLSAQDDLNDTPSVDRIDLATGAAVEVQRKMKDIWSWFTDPAGRVRGGISYSDKGYSIFYRGTPNGEMKRVQTSRSEGEAAVDSVRLLAGTDSALVLTNARTGRFAAYRYELGSADLGPPLFEHPEVDVTAVQIAPDGSTVEGVYYEDERPRVKWLVPELERLQAQIDRAFPGKVNRILSRSRDGKTVLIWSGGASDPGTYYVFDRATRRMNIFASPYDRLVDVPLAETKAVRYAARDGLSLPAYLTLPPGRPAKDLPLIVIPHGGPFMRDGYGFNPWVQMLASRGYAVLQPNFRGSTGYGRAFVERGYGEWGKAMQDDLDDGVGWLAREGVADPKRVCLMGASYGGYAALWGAIRNPDLYRCAISFAGVTDVRAMLKYDSSLMVAPRYSKLWRKHVEGEEKRDLAAISPLQQSARLRIPVLIAHGEKDTNVPVDQAKKLVAALARRGFAAESVIYPQAGHGFDRDSDSIDFLKRVEAFLARHNPS